MALTIHSNPSGYVPGYNPQNIVGSSTAVGASDFIYVIECTDTLTSATQEYRVPKQPVTGQLIWNLKTFAKKFLSHYVPNNEYGWRIVTNGVRKIDVEIKEYFNGNVVAGSPPVVFSYYVWNSALRYNDFPYYNPANYIYLQDSFTPNHKMLSFGLRSKTYSGKSDFLYFIAGVQPPAGINVNTYDASGNFIATSTIFNPFGSPTFDEMYLCIDVGLKGLSNISSGLVTGAYPIITPSVASYFIYDASVFTPTVYKTFDVACEPRHEVFTLHYLSVNGDFRTIHFPKVSVHTEEINKTTFIQNTNKLVSNVWSYNIHTPGERILNSSGKEQYVLNTDWISEAEAAIHRQLIASPLVYLDTTNGLIPVKVLNTVAEINKNWNKKMFGIEATIQLTTNNIYQNG